MLGDYQGSVGSPLGQCWVTVRQCWVNHINDFLQSSSALQIAGTLPLCGPGRCLKFSEPQPNSFVFEMLLFHGTIDLLASIFTTNQSSSALQMAWTQSSYGPGGCIKFSELQPNSLVFEMVLFHCNFAKICNFRAPPCYSFPEVNPQYCG
jgi:hypothetical protein